MHDVQWLYNICGKTHLDILLCSKK